jgi:spore coat protein U-like protein
MLILFGVSVMRRSWFLLALIGGALANSGVLAQTGQPPLVAAALPVSSSVLESCKISTLDSLSFGIYSPLDSSARLASGRLQVMCTKQVTFRASPNTGLNNQTLRNLAGENLSYGLYRDAAHTTPWGAPPTNYFVTGSSSYCRSVLVASGLDANGLRSFVSNAATSTFAIDYPTGNPSLGAQPGYAVFYYYGLPDAQNNCAKGGRYNRLASTPDTQAAVSSVLPTNETPVIYVPTSYTGTPYTQVSPGAGALNELLFYGYLAGAQDVGPGIYLDTVTVTVTF